MITSDSPRPIAPRARPTAPPPAARRLSRFSLVRPRVVDAIARELDNQLVILRAAAGAGKTEAVVHLAAALRAAGERPVAFVTVPTSPSDLWGRVAGALDEDSGHPKRIAAGDDPVQDLAALIGDRAVVILLDDLSARTADSLTDDILALLADCPRLCIVVSGRERTCLETARVAVRCDIVVLDACVLSFTSEETVALVALGGVTLSLDAAARIGGVLGGWPAAVRLVAAHLRLRAQPTVDEAIAVATATTAVTEYADEVVGALAPEIAAFAAEAAVAPVVTLELVEHVPFSESGRTPDALLTELERAGVGTWSESAGGFVITEVLCAPLVAVARRETPHAAARIHRATAEYLGRTGDALVAAELAADAGDDALAVALLEARFAECWRRDPDRLARLARRLPSDLVRDTSTLEVSLLWLSGEQSFSAQTVTRLTRVLETTRPSRPSPDGATATLALESARVRIRRRIGDYGHAAAAADRLAELVDRHAADDRSPSDVRAEALIQIGTSFLHAGRPKEGRWRLGEAFRCAVSPSVRVAAAGTLALGDLLAGTVHDAAAWLDTIAGPDEREFLASPWGAATRLASAGVHLETGRLTEAADVLDSLERDSPTSELWPVIAALRATHHLLAADAYTGMAALREAEDRNAATPVSRAFEAHLAAARSDLLIALRQARKAVGLLRSPAGLQDATAPALARAFLFAGQDQQAALVAQQWSAREQSSPRTTLQTLIVRAVTDLRSGRADAARDAVVRAVALTGVTGCLLPWSTIPTEDQAGLAALAPPSARAVVSALPLQFRENLTIPDLSTRERVVLSKLQSGAPIAHIARSLVVSPNTVKTQVRSVYRKLGVSTRREAIRAAHEWGILRPEAAPTTVMTGS